MGLTPRNGPDPGAKLRLPEFQKAEPLCYPVGHQRRSERANSEDFSWGGAGTAHPSGLKVLDTEG